MPLTIPDNLNTLSSHPQTPWRINPTVGHRLEQLPERQFKSCTVLDSDVEYAFVLRYFMASKPPGYSISKITYVVHPVHTRVFNSELQKMESEAPSVLPQGEQGQEHRERTLQRWVQISQIFRPLKAGEKPLEKTTVLPLWQGDTPQECLSICNSGFTDLRKQEALFGNGIYFTDSAHAASLDQSGHLLLAWVSIGKPYPVINDQPPPAKGSDMLALQGKGPYQNYDAHFIPVAPSRSGHYFPCYQNQEPVWDEIVIFQTTHAVTRFWVELAVDMPRAPDVRSSDIEGDLFRKLMQAHADNHFEEQVTCITEIGELYFKKKEWLKAALILNSAIAICKKHLKIRNLDTVLFDRLAWCETLFLQSTGHKTARINRETLIHYRTQLRKIRERHLQQFLTPVPEIMIHLTKGYRELLGSLINDLMKLLGSPPVGWACIGLGSMARDEMCPYSDVECAFLLKKETPEALAYFRTLSQLLQIRMVNLGETEFPVFGPRFPSPTPKGYSLDTGGNTPLGKPGLYELITTPQKLADFQTLHWMDADIILVNALNAVCWVAGEEKLVNDYIKAKNTKLDGTPPLPTFRSQLAQRLLEGHLIEFKPDLSQVKEDSSAFGIKKELYRPLQSILSSLALYHGIDAPNTTQSIKALGQKGILNQKGVLHLTEALETVLTLRFNAHRFYRKEEEYLCHRKPGEEADPTLLYLEEPQIKILTNVYKVLLPLHQCASSLFDPEKWWVCSFNDNGPLARGATLNKSLRYEDAQGAYQQAVALNPNDVNALFLLAETENKLAHTDEALRRYLKALEVAKEKYGENHYNVAACYGNIGTIHRTLGKNSQALEFFQKALEIFLQNHGENHPDVASCYNSIGSAHTNLGDNSQALEFYQKALKIRIGLYRENHLDVASCYSSIGSAYAKLGDNSQALEFHQKALKIRLQRHEENPLEVAFSYGSIGLAYLNLGKNSQALEFFQKDVEIELQERGENHLSVGVAYGNIGIAFSNLGEAHKALEFLQKSLELELLGYGENHPSVARNYSNIGIAYSNLGETHKALEHFKKALKIRIGLYGKNHPSVAAVLNHIADVYDKLGDKEKALKCRLLASQMKK